MSDQYLGEIRLVGFNFAPQGWALCQGQLLPIASNSALFSLLGTMYGGNGTTTFGLPDLRGRAPISFGQGLGLPNFPQGQPGGQVSVSLVLPNLPPHTHPVAPPVSNVNATSSSPVNAFPAVDVTTVDQRGVGATSMSYAASQVAGQTAATYQTGTTGNGAPVPIQSPYLTLNFIIALQGIYPQRS